MTSKIFFLLMIISCAATAQKLSKVKRKSPEPDRIREVYFVLKSEPHVKHGLYKKYLGKKLIERGYYKNNAIDSTWKYYSVHTGLIAAGNYTNGERSGVWNFYSAERKIVQRYNYDKDTLLYFDVKKESKIGHAPPVFPDTSKQQLPILIGGTAYMHTMIENNMRYPVKAWLERKQATVTVSFVVNIFGKISNVECTEVIGYGFEEESIRLMKTYVNDWIPGKMNGKKVKVAYTIPLKFKLN